MFTNLPPTMEFSLVDPCRRGEMLLITALALVLFRQATAAENAQSAVRSETLLRSSSSWDGEPYKSYPPGQPELSVLKITLAPHTQLEWHSHPIPSAAYIVAGELTVERKRDEKKQHFTAGQAVSETVDTLHRGAAGNEPVVLILFYAGRPGVPLTQPESILTGSKHVDRKWSLHSRHLLTLRKLSTYQANGPGKPRLAHKEN